MSNKAAVYAAFKSYADAFNSYDDQGCRDAFVWPLARLIQANGVEMVNNPPPCQANCWLKQSGLKLFLGKLTLLQHPIPRRIWY